MLSDEQRHAIETIYGSEQELSLKYFPGNVESQKDAQQLLALHQLDIISRKQLENRWSIQWSTAWPSGGKTCKRTLFQCSSGYHGEARQAVKLKYATVERTQSATPWTRQNPFDFTGCLAHAELTEFEEDCTVKAIVGHLEHNSACQAARMKRLPAVPLHPHVYEIALDQLKSGASITSIQMKNIDMLREKKYHDMDSYHPETANVRYNFLPTDSRHLYRLYNRTNGIDVTYKPQYNVHNWLNPESSHYRPDIAQAVFHYAARSEKGERFKVCIATDEMNAAAWKYVHHNQLILDGTFGVCSSRMLLFIAMGIDEEGKGVPVAFFLFSAPTGTQATHAGYDTEILREVLASWKEMLSRGHPTPFTPYVVITDTDVRERGALQRVWVDIWLLLCKFHLRQCWTNKRKTLKLVPTQDPQFWRDYVHGQLVSLEEQLIASTDFITANQLIADQRSNLSALEAQGSDAQHVSRAASTYLDYLHNTWMPEPLWQSWSHYGRVVASQILKVPVEGVLPTTNHLESFNGLLKRKYLPQWQRSGTRLRIDFLILILITKILPEIFALRRTLRDYKQWLGIRFSNGGNGLDLVRLRKSTGAEPPSRSEGNLCWWPSDVNRDAEALAIVRLNRIYDFRQQVNLHQYEATCIASRGSLQDPNHSRYYVYIHRDGYAACTCPDFTSRGGACKHLRALRLVLESWVRSGSIIPFYYPATAESARNVRS
ncbi:hypothetical protein B0H11DRAFT_1799451, partial [Mycena galericulata]